MGSSPVHPPPRILVLGNPEESDGPILIHKSQGAIAKLSMAIEDHVLSHQNRLVSRR